MADEPTIPWPPRYRWVKRWAVVGAVAAAAVVGTRLWWGHVAQQRVNGYVAELRGKGEPILPEDFDTNAGVPDSENAAMRCAAAGAMASATARAGTASPAQSVHEFPDFLPYRPLWHQLADAACAANAAVYPEVRRARQLKVADWNVRLRSPIFTQLRFAPYNDLRNLANLLGDTALRAHFRHNDFEAMELVADTRALSEVTGRAPTLIGHLVGVGIDALAVNRLLMIAGGLQVTEGEPTTAPSTGQANVPRPATRAQVRAAIASLLDDTAQQDSRRRALLGERAAMFDGVWYTTRRSLVLRPMFDLDALRTARRVEPYLDALSIPTWPAANAAISARLKWGRGGLSDRSDLTGIIGRIFSGSFGRAVEVGLRVRVDRRAAAAALATRLFLIDNGRYPASLDELVPTYLPELPMDTYARDGGPLRYVLADQGRRPLLYSVGENGTDDYATGNTPLPTETMWGWKSNSLDQFRDLSQWMPPTPPLRYQQLEDESNLSGPETGDDQ
jgi:hypothetical protein